MMTSRDSAISLRNVTRLIVGLLALLGLLGCNAARTINEATPVPSDESTEFAAWRDVAPGMQRRELSLQPYSGGVMQLVRLDPALVTFRVHYDPYDPRILSGWQERLPDADLIANAAFFNENRLALGLVVSDGQMFGQTLAGYGGMFQVNVDGVRVRSLVSEPYIGEPLVQAVQAFPMLIESGGVMAGRGDGFDTPSRRTWIGQDAAGQIIIGVSHYLLTLVELQEVLYASDLDLFIAFGLDGGRSSGMVISVPGAEARYPAFDRLPSVLAVYVP